MIAGGIMGLIACDPHSAGGGHRLLVVVAAAAAIVAASLAAVPDRPLHHEPRARLHRRTLARRPHSAGPVSVLG